MCFNHLYNKLCILCLIISEWLAKIIEDKELLLKKCEDIFNVISDKTDILDFLWNKVWEQVSLSHIFGLLFNFIAIIDNYYVCVIFVFR